jgi:cytochrome c oxidase cbb3-type subunit 3
MVGVFVYACIVFGVVYMVRFEVLGADNRNGDLKKWLKPKLICRIHENRTGLMDEKR